MPRLSHPLAVSALVLMLVPAQGRAQEGPSFDCRYAGTATEHAICASPGLARLEQAMYGSYLQLVEAVGERKARRIADRFLERRQACEGDEACIARRLEITMRVFDRRAGRDTEFAAAEPSEAELEGLDTAEDFAALEPAPAPVISPAPAPLIEAPPRRPVRDEDEVAVAAAVPGVPLAAQAPLPDDLGALLEDVPARTETLSAQADDVPALEEDIPVLDETAPLSEETELAAVTPAAPEQLDEAIAGAELTSSDEAAPFDQPISWAFMDLIRHQRAVVQERLQEAGFYEGPAEGSWDRATLEALEAFLASEEGQGFDASTQGGATLALDYIRSDAFAEANGLATAAVAEEEAAPAPDDPLASADW